MAQDGASISAAATIKLAVVLLTLWWGGRGRNAALRVRPCKDKGSRE